MNGLFNTNIINTDRLFQYMGDCIRVWPIFLACVGIALVIGLVYLCVIRIFGGCIAYITILLILGALIALGYFFHMRIDVYKQQGDTNYQYVMTFFAALFYFMAAVWLLVILFMCNKIRLAIALAKDGAIYVGQTLSILFVPFLMFFVCCLFIAFWVALAIFIYSTGEVTKNPNTFIAQVTW